ncbi:hypothetical protein DO97_08600 [Neosynechococcus sphagnicola sy1]|uniref:DUF8082 domain-containing protein n=1 Tax=Neosynechococcus sphagnicola sy1 TaxID=1497020 RepID=A0A098TIN9_9CYAN|nr:hypothetical protein [Neosynechococcus sphagnicola]KGF72430.1 hypothetical protein DO97_08600 [Neosynechococcus sphagnicola sy1]
MLLLHDQDLELLGSSQSTSAEARFLGRVFVKKQSFPKISRQEALKCCRGYLDTGDFCVLVESSAELTLWFQKPAASPSQTTTTPETTPAGTTSPPKLKFSNALSAAQQKQLEQLLAEAIGPIASLLIQQLVPEARSTADLLNHLAARVPEPSRQQFLKRAQSLLQSLL